MHYLKSNNFRFILVFILILIVFLLPHVKNLNQLPGGMHGWAQSDRYAIALNFLTEDNILTPKTNALYTDDGKVGVEFSGLAYLAAKITVLLNARDYLPLIFRGINLAIIALFITFFLTTLFHFNVLKISIAFLFWFATPLLLFYGYNFIPDSVGFGLAMGSLGFYYLYYQKSQPQYLLIALVIGAIGGLIKLPILLYPIAMLTHQLYLIFKSKQLKMNVLIPMATGILCVIGVLVYDYIYLIEANKRLWSVIFMSKPNPILNLRDLFETITGILFWRFEFFNPIQFAILIVLFTLMLFKFKSIPTFYKEFGTIALMGLLVYLIGLGKQLIHHDYYFLSSFLPLILLIASMLSKRLLQVSPNAVKLLLFPIAIAISIPSFMQATARQQDHFTIRDNTLDNDLTWLKNGAKKLDNMGVGPNEIIFVLYDFAPNTSLVYFNRKGLVFNHEQMSRKEPHIEFWIEKLKPDYLIVKSDWENAFFENKPEIARKWNRIPQDGFILYKKP